MNVKNKGCQPLHQCAVSPLRQKSIVHLLLQ